VQHLAYVGGEDAGIDQRKRHVTTATIWLRDVAYDIDEARPKCTANRLPQAEANDRICTENVGNVVTGIR
jgi:hypothetical protein